MRGRIFEFSFWAVVTIILWWQTSLFADETIAEYAFGADGWVKIVLLGIMLGASGQLLIGVLAARGGKPASTPAPKIHPKTYIAKLLHFNSTRLQTALIFIAPLIYLFLMQRLGFFFLTPFFIIAYLWILEVRKWHYLLLVAAAVYGVVLLIFTRIFYVALPVGSWEIFYNINTSIITLVRLGA